MNALLQSLAATAFAAHALFGCGVHDVLASLRGTGHVHQAAPETCGHHHGSSSHDQTPPPCDCQIECHDCCTYLPPRAANVDAESSCVSLAIVDFAPDGTLTLHWFTRSEALSHALAAEPPLRLHLWHQILLI